MENQITKRAEYQNNSLMICSPTTTAVDITKAIKGVSLQSIRDSDVFTLATMCKEHGRETSEKLIAQFVIELAVALNLHQKISDDAIRAIADDVYSIGYFLKANELGYFFKQFRRGKYGGVYENLNSIKICTALNEFIIDRSIHWQRVNQNKTHQINGRQDRRENPKDYLHSMQRIASAKLKSGELNSTIKPKQS